MVVPRLFPRRLALLNPDAQQVHAWLYWRQHTRTSMPTSTSSANVHAFLPGVGPRHCSGALRTALPPYTGYISWCALGASSVCACLPLNICFALLTDLKACAPSNHGVQTCTSARPHAHCCSVPQRRYTTARLRCRSRRVAESCMRNGTHDIKNTASKAACGRAHVCSTLRVYNY